MADLFDVAEQHRRLAKRHEPLAQDAATLPPLSAIEAASSSLPDLSRPEALAGRAAVDVASHISLDLVPALNGQAASGRYYGFVTGGALPIAEWADNVVSRADQNVGAHLPQQTVATAVEDAALRMIVALLRLGDRDADWPGRIFTTGATASNVLGLACGREAVVASRLRIRRDEDGPSCDGIAVAEMGLLTACREAGIAELLVLTSAGHSSLSKAASVVGFGRRGVKELPRSAAQPWLLDLDAVERELRRKDCACVIAVSAGEVNTGRFALRDLAEWTLLRDMANRYGAWIHVDGAFGLFVRALEDKAEFKVLRDQLRGVEMANSITVDGHKLLNVPYDCGMFFTRSNSVLQAVFTNGNAAYLSSPEAQMPSPFNVGLENSRRFRALPAYAVLLSEGRPGMATLLSNMVQLARGIAEFLRRSEHYELLPGKDDSLEEVFVIVLFRAKDAALNEGLVDRINETRQMYVTGTHWDGQRAVRIAVASWRVDPVRDLHIVKGILTCVAEGRKFDLSTYCTG